MTKKTETAEKFVDALTREILWLTPSEARLRDVVPYEWSTEGMNAAAALRAMTITATLTQNQKLARRVEPPRK